MHLAAGALLALGRYTDALHSFSSIADGYSQLQLRPVHLAQVLTEHGDVQHQLGFAHASSGLYQQASQVLEEHCARVGLREMQVRAHGRAAAGCSQPPCRPSKRDSSGSDLATSNYLWQMLTPHSWPLQAHCELRNVYLQGLQLLPMLLLRKSRAAATCGDRAQAASCAQSAMQSLQYTMVPGALAAEVALQLGHQQRRQVLDIQHGTMQPDTSSPAAGPDAEAQRIAVQLSTAAAALGKAVSLSHACGGHDHALMRAAALEQAMLHLAAHDPLQAASCMGTAAATSAQHTAFLQETQQLLLLQADSSAGLPSWFLSSIAGQQQHMAASASSRLLQVDAEVSASCEPAAGCTSTASWHVRNLAAGAAHPAHTCSRCTSLAQLLRAAAQMQQLHLSLRTASTKYSSECCWAQVPELVRPAAAMAKEPPPPAGTIMAQWHRYGATAASQSASTHCLPDAATRCSNAQRTYLLYFVAPPGGSYVYGTLQVSVAQVTALHSQVRGVADEV
jgi:hypothetical protein